MTYIFKSIFLATICYLTLVSSACPPPQSHLLHSLLCFFFPSEYPIVSTNVGEIGGNSEYNQIANGKVSRFLGIRYGEAPIGDKRFMKPVPAKPFTSTVWALNYGNKCVEIFPPSLQITSDEDCLFLNVYVPERCTPTSPCAVMIWIYGGAFLFGSGNNNYYGPENFLANNIIFVTFNYRVGPFGFLSTEDENIPGNAGLLDQHLAIKWVNNNIAAFGGDANSITIYGQSAGSVSVCYHCLSDASAGLFQKIILESGSCLTDWAYNRQPRLTLLQLAQYLGNTTSDLAEITAGLQSANAEDLATAALEMNLDQMSFQLVTMFPPSIDYNHPPYISDSPRNIVNELLRNNQPICHGAEVISGMNTNDGAIIRTYFLLEPQLLSDIILNKELLTPPKCNLEPGSNESITVANKIYRFYFSNGTDEWSFYKYATHMLFLDGIATFAKALIDSGKTPYMYNFNYCGSSNHERNLLFPLTGCDKIRAIHSDELNLIFIQNYFSLSTLLSWLGKLIQFIIQATLTSAEHTLAKQMTRSFTNLAKTGTPNLGVTPDPLLGITWLPATNKSDMPWFRFDTSLSMVPHYLSKYIQFWANVCNVNV